uniref:SJCHGC02129 protein n=1 Tax=Schistosoma japonicum TaxID=6182 RepID=Q5DCV5_SCHJA|nr:SJCHGC02129 protein [Schistosoma japonicum]
MKDWVRVSVRWMRNMVKWWLDCIMYSISFTSVKKGTNIFSVLFHFIANGKLIRVIKYAQMRYNSLFDVISHNRLDNNISGFLFCSIYVHHHRMCFHWISHSLMCICNNSHLP